MSDISDERKKAMPVFTVPQELDGITVQNFLRRHCNVSARLLARLKRTTNGITANGRHIRSIDILSKGDIVELVFPDDQCDIVPIEMPLDIVYEDDALLVINKPPFMPVHPVRDHQLDTLANAVTFYSRSKNENYTFRAVNRLDRDTSGLVLIAKSGYAHTFLSGHTEKLYAALCEGEIYGSGTIDAPIRIKEGHTIQRETGEGGVRAVTHYKAIKQAYGHTYLEIELETGRTHQIRTHFASIGHPLAGDDMYGGSRKYFSRQCLHCARLTFIHPISHEKIVAERYPEEFFGLNTEGIKP